MARTRIIIIDGEYAPDVRTLAGKLLAEDHEHLVEWRIVLALVRKDHDERWTHAELGRELDGVEPGALADALGRLAEAGVITLDGDGVQATQPVLYLAALGLVSL